MNNFKTILQILVVTNICGEASNEGILWRRWGWWDGDNVHGGAGIVGWGYCGGAGVAWMGIVHEDAGDHVLGFCGGAGDA